MAEPILSVVSKSTKFIGGTHLVPEGIVIRGNDVELDGSGTHLVGNGSGYGIKVSRANKITIRNFHISGFMHGIRVEDCQDITIENCEIRNTAEVQSNTKFLDIWRGPEDSYGGAVYLRNVNQATIQHNDLQHQMCGLLSFHCESLNVRKNNASYNSGFGFHLFNTIHSRFEDNYADYCNRWHVRESGSHLGADASGLLLVGGSSHNTFKNNCARLGGDGFFISGLSHTGEFAPCNDNLFENNDVSFSPNNGFEATFSAGNVFRDNTVNGCNFGFWLGFSSHNKIEHNRIHHNRFAGVGVENGFGFFVKGNEFSHNQHGLLLWSKHLPQFLNAVPENHTSYNWEIEENHFHHNHKGVRIAANQNHGIHPFPPQGEIQPPNDHRLKNNLFDANETAIEIEDATSTQLLNNRFSGDRQNNLIEN
jgi:parallel beta-helix repeat protein